MAKGLVPRDFINQLVASTDIVDIISKSIPLKKRGINLTACCPFHDEKTPSFYVSPQKQIYHCFGCGAGGNVISFLKEYERLDFVETIEELASFQGLSVPYEASNTTDYSLQYNNKQKELSNQLYEITDKANKLFRWQLKSHSTRQKAINYIKSRSISAQTAKVFSLGFASNQWQLLLDTLSKIYDISSLETAGLITHNESNRYYDKFRNRLIFPIRNRQGKVIAFGGRALEPEQKPKYLNSPETPIFHKSNEIYGLHEIRNLRNEVGYLLITEGYMDVISLYEHGFKNAVATLGTAITEQHIKRLFRETQTLIFAFDGDQAGIQAASRALVMILPLLNQHRQAKFLKLPQGEDPDSYIKKHGLANFIALVDKATPTLEHALNTVITPPPKTPDEKAQSLEKLITLLVKMDITYQVIFKQMLQEEFKLTLKQLDQVINIHIQRDQKKPNNKPIFSAKKPLKLSKERLTLEEKAMALIFQKPNAISAILIPDHLDENLGDTCLLLIQLASKAKELPNTALLLDYMIEINPNQKQYLFAISAIDFPLLDEKEVETELNATFMKLKRRNDDILLNMLIEKSKHSLLSNQEKTQMKQLLSRH